jgi:hypothetical protein
MSIFAYLDAGTGSIIIQTIVGGIAAIGVVARVYWSKIKRFFRRGGDEQQTDPAVQADASPVEK